MKLNFIFGLLFSVVALQMKGAGGTPEGLPPFVRFPGLEQEVYITRDTCKSVEGRFPGFSPFFRDLSVNAAASEASHGLSG